MNRNLNALKHKAYLLIWTGSLLSNIGNWMENVGQGWVVASQTHSAFLVELLSFAQFLPVIFLAMPAGILADRYDRRKILIIAQVFMCIFATALAVLAHFGKATPTVVILITFLEGAAWALNGPAWQSILPHLVPRKDLESAIALNSIQYNLARLIGPAIAGLVVAHFGFAYAFDINALSFIGVIFVIAIVKFDPALTLPASVGEKERKTFSEAFHWVWQSRGAKRIIISIGTFAILAAPIQGLMPFIASDVLKVGPRALGILLACLGSGAVTGAVLLGKLPSYYPRHHLIPLSIFALGILEFIYSQAPTALLSGITLFVLGIFFLSVMVSCNTAMQLLVPDKLRGRVMSILLVAHVGMLPVGHIIGGTLASVFGPQRTLVILSIVMIFFGFATLLRRVPEIDGLPNHKRRTHFKNFFSEVILASSHRADALALDRSAEKIST
jgi:MFS family permease